MSSLDLSRAAFYKSSYSQQASSCVEVARNIPGIVAVRDTKNRQRGTLVVSAAGWRAFTDQIKDGQLSR